MRPRLVIGNWKMNGSLGENAARLNAVVRGTRDASAAIAVCVPFPYLAQARELLAGSHLSWGAQDVSAFDSGAHTGEVAPAMLVDFGCRYVLVGHSERRALNRETDDMVARKFAAAQRHGLTPVLCVGETLAERQAGFTEAVVARQLDAVLETGSAELAAMVIAYEPVWAIGSGSTATPEQAQAVQGFIRHRLAARAPGIAPQVPILYGGSVTAATAGALFAMPDIDGGLVGGASLLADEFVSICHAQRR
jgi:triosephosphate isomerase